TLAGPALPEFSAGTVGVCAASSLRAAMRRLTLARLAPGFKFVRAVPPVIHLRHDAADPSAGPDQIERQEQPPGIVAIDDRARDHTARHRGGVEPVAAKTAHEPQPRRELADLRHAVQRVAEDAGPKMLEVDFAELRIGRADVGLELSHKSLRIELPGAHAARPHQPVAADDAVMIVGELGVTHRAAIADRLLEPRAERRGG